MSEIQVGDGPIIESFLQLVYFVILELGLMKPHLTVNFGEIESSSKGKREMEVETRALVGLKREFVACA